MCSGPNIKFVRKSEISQEIYENKSVISIGGDRKVSIKYGASAQLASQIAANLDFSLTVPPQKKPLIDLKAPSDNAETLSVHESLMNTGNNPMITPHSVNQGTGSGAKRPVNTEADPFQMSENASIVPGSEKGSGVNLLSSHLGSSFNHG